MGSQHALNLNMGNFVVLFVFQWLSTHNYFIVQPVNITNKFLYILNYFDNNNMLNDPFIFLGKYYNIHPISLFLTWVNKNQISRKGVVTRFLFSFLFSVQIFKKMFTPLIWRIISQNHLFYNLFYTKLPPKCSKIWIKQHII